MTRSALGTAQLPHAHARRAALRRPSSFAAGCRRDARYDSILVEKEAEIKQQRNLIAEFTKRDARNAIAALQLQAENFFMHLELQALRNAVRGLADGGLREERALGAFRAEAERLEGELRGERTPGELKYNLSADDWLAIIEGD